MDFKIDPTAIVQKLVLAPDALRFQVPFALSISGPSQGIT
jgi:hypothetical protein